MCLRPLCSQRCFFKDQNLGPFQNSQDEWTNLLVKVFSLQLQHNGSIVLDLFRCDLNKTHTTYVDVFRLREKFKKGTGESLHLQLWFLFLQVCLSSVAAVWSQFYWRQSENREEVSLRFSLLYYFNYYHYYHYCTKVCIGDKAQTIHKSWTGCCSYIVCPAEGSVDISVSGY